MELDLSENEYPLFRIMLCAGVADLRGLVTSQTAAVGCDGPAKIDTKLATMSAVVVSE
jgi:hypothetical protein